MQAYEMPFDRLTVLCAPLSLALLRLHARRKDKNMTIALVFPGQGSQAVGMGMALAEAFPVARETFGGVGEA